MHASLPLVGISKEKLEEIWLNAERIMSMTNEEIWREHRIDQDLLKDDARESLLP